MHHSLHFYDQHRPNFVRAYMFFAGLTRVPVIGDIVRFVANGYGRHGHGGYILTLAEAEQIVESARTIALGPCSCRQVFHNCSNPVMSEIVIGNEKEDHDHKNSEFKPISKEEAKGILRKAHNNRLTHGIMRCGEHFYAICNCCTCCCVPYRLRVNHGIGQALIRNKNVVQDFQKQQLV
jgi:hypothetical protein